MKLNITDKRFIIEELSKKTYNPKKIQLKEELAIILETEWLKILPKPIVRAFNCEETNQFIKYATGFDLVLKNDTNVIIFRLQINTKNIPTNEFSFWGSSLIPISNQLYSEIYKIVEPKLIELKLLQDSCSKFEYDLKCTLDSITTHEKLKNEFPEAYELLKKPLDNCTSIETLRTIINDNKKNK